MFTSLGHESWTYAIFLEAVELRAAGSKGQAAEGILLMLWCLHTLEF
jgi:hypothetical protein